MESVRGIDDLDFLLLPQFFRREPTKDAAHRRVAVEEVIAIFHEDSLELPVRRDVGERERRARDWNRELAVALRHRLLARRAVVHLPALPVEPFHVRQIELGEVRGVREEEDFMLMQIIFIHTNFTLYRKFSSEFAEVSQENNISFFNSAAFPISKILEGFSYISRIELARAILSFG